MHIAVLRMRGAEPKLIRPPQAERYRVCIINHVLHLMLMGLGREGSISIAYLILLPGRDRIPLGCAFGWRSGRVQVRLCPAERCTVCITSVPVPQPCVRHRFGMELEFSTLVRPQRGDRNETESPVLHLRKDRSVARWARGAVSAGLSYTPYRYRTTGMCSARRPATARRPPALIRSSHQPTPLIRSHSRTLACISSA